MLDRWVVDTEELTFLVRAMPVEYERARAHAAPMRGLSATRPAGTCCSSRRFIS